MNLGIERRQNQPAARPKPSRRIARPIAPGDPPDMNPQEIRTTIALIDEVLSREDIAPRTREELRMARENAERDLVRIEVPSGTC
jgi:hypothetical protein